MTNDLRSRVAYAVAKARHRRGLRRRRSPGPPVVVFSMAKTGSSAVVAALRAAGVEDVHHVHDLDPVFLATEEQEYHWSGRPWRNWEAQELSRRMPTPGAPWKVISLVRDPIAQSVSAFFQPGARRGYVRADTTVDELLERFGDRLERMPLRWFDAQVRPAFGIDVYDRPFDRAQGCQRMVIPGVELLLLRREDLAARAGEPLARLIGSERPLEVPQVNRAEEKEHAALYRAFVDALQPSEAVLERTYSSRYVRHFYDESEIEGFRRRWGSGPGPRASR